MTDAYELIERIEKRIAELPNGYISKKNIQGKIRYYLQWREEGKIKSKYIREEELDQLEEQIEERKRLETHLREMQGKYPTRVEKAFKFETNVTIGANLLSMVKKVKGLEKREIFHQITNYLYSKDYTRVCAVYGLRRTGKTTMLFQAIADMSDEDFKRSAYIKVRTTDQMDMVIHDLEKLNREGFLYVFIDEVTLMKDFIDSAALFSDIYAQMGMKIVLSGTDSLGFWFAEGNELYDRVRMVHTTFIPYREYSRLLGIDSIDEYIRYGGTLRAGEIDFDDEELRVGDASFRDDETTRKYIDTAICQNIQHSLECFKYGSYFRHLYDLYDAGELTGAINRIIEDMNHRFVLHVLTRDFKSNDYGMAAHNLKTEKDVTKRTSILDKIDREAITKRLMEILDIRNKEQQTITITQSHVILIKGYLDALDLITKCPIEAGEIGMEKEERILFNQPGMRYCQAQALVYSVMKDDRFALLPKEEKDFITECILEEVRGRMLEDIILLETSKALGKNYNVFKLQFKRGEFDMVIYDKKENACGIYEIKHSSEYVREQARHLMDEEKIALTTPRYGQLVKRYVLYLGDNMDTEDGILYRNAEEFLKKLPEFTLDDELVPIDTAKNIAEYSKTISELREQIGMGRKEFCDYFQVPYQLLVEWESDEERVPRYVLRMLDYYVKSNEKR